MKRARPEDPTALLPFGEPDSTPAPDRAEGPRRVFLGWDEAPLTAAARWLREDSGLDLGQAWIALPGGRAVRHLEELLARSARGLDAAPRVLTVGALVDQLVTTERPAASRLARTLAWRRALTELKRGDLERLARGASRRPEAEAQLRLAETVRAVHGLLAPEGLDFEHLKRADLGPDDEGERARWSVLARAQETWRRALDDADLCDPHEGRRAAIQAGRVDDTRPVVLIGVADMNQLLAQVLRRLGPRATALVVAPPELAEGFDELGRLVPGFWLDRPLDLATEDWFVEEKPADQADRVETLLAGWSARRRAEEITVGLCDEEVAPYLERRLAQGGARLRSAAGTPLAAARPTKLLAATADLLERRGFAELAAFARHPDAAPLLAGDADPAEVLDRYHADHLPSAVLERWHGESRASRSMEGLSADVTALLGELWDGAPRPLAAWTGPLEAFLLRVYGEQALDPEQERERLLAGALAAVGEVLEELARIPVALGGQRVLAAEALRLGLRGLRGRTVAPAPARPGEPTVEALGWLELPLDDAPALVVSGFNEGRVPQSVQGDAFLPDGLRTRLGLADNDARLARDAYAMAVLLATRDDLAFVTGRRTQSGDPLVPSRLAFQVPRGEVTARVRRFLPGAVRPEPAADAAAGAEPRDLAARTDPPRVTRMSVTSFRRFLESPYLFYLERVLRLRTRDDRARELDPLRFGSFAHDVLQAFGEHEVRDARSADTIEDFLVQTAGDLAAQRFGEEPLPTVALQLEQLKYRFRRFAEVQAWRRAEGWRLLRAEWTVEDAPFEVDGEPMLLTGKLDRVDLHEDGRWAILDYKTGEVGAHPEKAARDRDKTWRDLQLPLYRLLAAPLALEHGIEAAPELGYFHLGKDEDHIGLRLVEGWTDADYDSALECASDVVRRVRAGDFFHLGRAKPWEPILRALVGEGVLAP